MRFSAVVPALCWAVFSLPNALSAQTEPVWIVFVDGGTIWDQVADLAVDDSGNVIVTGSSHHNGGYDFLTVKYNREGDVAWYRHYDGASHQDDMCYALAVDGERNVYVTGSAWEHVGDATDITTVKYDYKGDTVWTAHYRGPAGGHDLPCAIAVDSAGYVYVFGTSDGIGSNNPDYVLICYYPWGVENWSSRYDGSEGPDRAKAMAVASDHKSYVTGTSAEPGGLPDIVTLAYDNRGFELWRARYDGPAHGAEQVNALTLGLDGNVLVAGGSRSAKGDWDGILIQYGQTGSEKWTRRWTSPVDSNDVLTGVETLGPNSVFVTGWTRGYSSSYDILTSMYDGDGTEKWSVLMNGVPDSQDFPSCCAVDTAGGFYIGGGSWREGSGLDFVMLKYDSLGNKCWSSMYNGSGNGEDYAVKIAVDDSGYVYVTGSSMGDGTNNRDYLTMKLRQTSGVKEDRTRAASVAPHLPTMTRGVLCLGPASPLLGREEQGARTQDLLDVRGRLVLPLHPGMNDLSRLAPGVYFARNTGQHGLTRIVLVR